MREVEKYPSIVGFEPGTLTSEVSMLTNYAEMRRTKEVKIRQRRSHQNEWLRDSSKAAQKQCQEWHQCRRRYLHEENVEEDSTSYVLLSKRTGGLESLI